MSTTHRRKSGAIRRIKQVSFIKAFTHLASVTRAACVVGINRDTHYEWMKDPEYQGALKDAVDITVLKLEDEARELALYGSEKMVFYKGEPVIDPRTGEPYIERQPSDRLLIYLLERLAPDKYLESRVATAPLRLIDEQIARFKHALRELDHPDAESRSADGQQSPNQLKAG